VKRHPYPLQWPDGWAVTPTPEPSNFTVVFTDALRSLERELDRLGATEVVITSNLPTRRDGRPYATGLQQGHSPGIAVYFVLHGAERVMACDRWDDATSNIRAIACAIEAIRGLDRWGAAGAALKVWEGFAALPAAPAGPSDPPHWSSVLGVSPYSAYSEIKRAYRVLILDAHPDAGGDAVMAARINAAFDQAMQELGPHPAQRENA
jgi:hypothetical protein